MRPKVKSPIPQVNFLQKHLLEQLNPKQPLMLLAKKIPWSELEKAFMPLYAERGRAAKPIRMMVGLLILKQLYNLSDERVVETWTQNPYYQAFCGEEYFQWEFPCTPSELTHFRNRIGPEGAEKIFQISIAIHGSAAHEKEVVIDTTVQEKNITYPTDTKTILKIISHVLKWARTENVVLRQNYSRTLKKLKRILRFDKSKENAAKVEEARKKISVIANQLLDEISRKLSETCLERYQEKIDLYRRAVNQKKDDKDKIYSLHEPHVACIAKGKEHKKYEFGSLVALALTKTSNILIGIANFSSNIYDGDTAIPTIKHIEKLTGSKPETIYADRGFRGREEEIEEACGTKLVIPDIPSKTSTPYEKRKAQKNFKRRCAIEPVIGHVKNDFRMLRNFLKGIVGDEINAFMSGSAFNFRKWMRLAAERLLHLFLSKILSCQIEPKSHKNLFPGFVTAA